MAESKPIASLSAGLLARKGAARPAMRRQMPLGGFASLSGNVAHQAHEDLGWNDMGYDVDPVQSDVEPVRHVDHGLTPMLTHPAAPDRPLDDFVDAPTAAEIAPITVGVSVPDQVPSPVAEQQAALAASLAGGSPTVAAETQSQPRPRVARAPRVKPGARGSYAFTLRLDPERHLKLRLASVTANLSSQQLLVRLLDQFLADQPAVTAFANAASEGQE